MEETVAVAAAYHLSTGDFAALTDEAWKRRMFELTFYRERLFRLKTEPWRRWANGFSCFFFCIVGAPLAVKLRKSDYLTVFFMCFLPILIGTLLCLVGQVVTMPLTLLMFAVAYLKMTGQGVSDPRR